jgi:hypothetical protein
LNIVDVTNPAAPVQVGRCVYGNPTQSESAIAVSGNIAYVMHDSRNATLNRIQALKIIDVSDKSHPTLLNSSIPSTEAGIAVLGNYAYVSDHGAMRILDVTNPADPVTVAQVAGTEFVNAISAISNYVFIARSFHGVEIVDVTDPSHPRHIMQISSSYDDRTAGRSATAVYRAGDKLLVANSERGVDIWPMLFVESVGVGHLKLHAPGGAVGNIEAASGLGGPWTQVAPFAVENESSDIFDPSTAPSIRFYRAVK